MNIPSEVRTAAIVAPSPVPLRLGGAERHWEALRRALDARGIATDVVKVPVRERTLVDLIDAYEDFGLLDLSHVDLVITGKYPAWMVQHPFHVVWMLHPLRGLYDTWNPAMHEPTGGDDPTTAASRLAPWVALVDRLAEGPEVVGPYEVVDRVREIADLLPEDSTDAGGPLAVPSPLARAVVHHLDRWALHPSRVARHAAISQQVADRADYFPPGVPVAVVHPPSSLEDPGDTGEPGDVFVTVGRLDRPKRIDLAIEAVRRVQDPSVGLVVVGDGPDRARLEQVAGGDDRIRFVGRVQDEELSELYRAARGVLVTPAEEDFGYVTVEAMQHGRAVITTTDAGGPTELVTDGRDGSVCEPDPRKLQRAVEALWSDAGLAARLGRAARTRARELDWPTAVDRLLEHDVAPASRPDGRGRLVAVSTYPILGWPGGGPERAGHLVASLARRGWGITIVCLSDRPEATRGIHHDLGEGIEQIEVVPSSRHLAAEARLRRLTDVVAVTDVAASVLWSASPELVRELRHALRGAAGVIAVQPYLAPAVVDLDPQVPLVYDAHNHELALKSQMLPDDEAGRWMLARVAEAEDLAISRAALVVATTGEDLAAIASGAPGGVLRSATAVVPNGVDTAKVRPRSEEEHAAARRRVLALLEAPSDVRHVALFVGSAHRPNILAGRSILHLAPRLGDVLFVLAGRHTDQLDRDVPSNVRLVGQVSSERLEELLRAADVALNPMEAGGGSNLKLLEYFAAGVPVVSTPTGARGLANPHEVALVVEADQVALGIRESLRSPNRARVDAARRLVEVEFDWSRVGEQFADAVDGVLGNAASRPAASTRPAAREAPARENERPSPP
jgi:glycosyltransferase involved in cell wall biosynthesis